MARRAGGLAALAAVGFAISAYLAAYQLGLVSHVWDPLFGSGSERVLRSAVSRLLPVPDALLGAGAYLVDATLASALALELGDRHAVRLALAVVASLGAVVAIVLVVLQPLVAGTFCTLCLASAAVSIVLAAGAIGEMREGATERGTRPPGGRR